MSDESDCEKDQKGWMVPRVMMGQMFQMVQMGQMVLMGKISQFGQICQKGQICPILVKWVRKDGEVRCVGLVRSVTWVR